MACQLPEAISKIEEILSKNVEGIASAMLSGIQINMLNEAKNNLQSAIEIRMARMQSNIPGSESTKKDFRSEFKQNRPSAAKLVDKEVAKFDVATQAISDGTNNSTAGFVKDFYGDNANTGTYTKDDVVYLSTNGNRTGRVIPVKNGVLQGAYKNIDKAIEAGAKFVADTSKHLVSTGRYNVGEVELAEYLQSKGYTREDKDGYGLWSPYNSSIQNETKSLDQNNESLKSKTAGWKIHLSFKVNDKSILKLEEILNSFDKNIIPSFKIGKNSGQEGKDATIYVGSADNRNLVVNKIQNEFGKYLTEVGEDAKFDDKIHSKGIAYRFDIGSIDNEFHQYGHNGFPALNEDIKNTFGMNKDERTKVFIESSKKSEKILEKKYGTFFTGTKEDSQSYNPQSEPDGVDSKYDANDDLSIKIKEKLLSTYKGIYFSKLNIESSSAAIDYIGNKSIYTIPHEYASVYIDILRDTVFVDAAIKNIAKYRNMSIENAEKLLIENMGKNYIEYIKNGTGDKHIMGIVDKIWSKILDFFGKFDNTINEINIISERFYNGVNSDAISYSPKKGFEKVDTEATFIDQPFAGNVLKTVIETNPDLISFTGSASLALQGDIYRKGKNGITDLHDLDFIVKGENALDSARDKMFKNFSATEIYNFGLSSGSTERISTLIVVPKEYKIPHKSIKRSNKLRVTSYEIIDSYGKTIGTYNAELDSSGQIIAENTTGFKAVIVDFMQEGNSEKSGIKYYSSALNTEITLADPESVFSAKNDIGKDIPRDKDVRDSVSFYGRNKYKTISKDDIEAAKDIMSNNKKECE